MRRFYYTGRPRGSAADVSGIVHAPQNGDLMSATPFLSVIVPVYNAEAYLRDCVDSILAQTFDDYEVILVDDGSTDRCPAICDEYAARNPRVRVLHQPNGGLPAARQAGFRLSTGNYCAFVDSDDTIDVKMYFEMCHIAMQYDVDIVHCDFLAVMPTKTKNCSIPFPYGYYDKQHLRSQVYPQLIYTGHYFTFGAAPNIWNKIFRRSLLEKYLLQVPHEIQNGEDFLVTYPCMLEANSVYFIDQAFYHYYSRINSMCRVITKEQLQKLFILLDSIDQVLDCTQYPELNVQLTYYTVYQTLLYCLPLLQEMYHNKEKLHTIRQLYLDTVRNPHINHAMSAIQIKDITGIRNKLFVYGFRLHLYPLILLALLKK